MNRLLRKRQAMRGQNMLLAAGAVLLGAVIVLTLRQFEHQEAEPKRPVKEVYLSDESSVIPSRSKKDSLKNSQKHVVSSGLSWKRGSGFSCAAGSRVFASAGSGSRSNISENARLLASPNVSVRLLGTPDGDFIYHRDHGWMKYVNGEWVVVSPYDLPDEIKSLYPQLCTAQARDGNVPAGPGGCCDGDFSRKGWIQGLEPGSEESL